MSEATETLNFGLHHSTSDSETGGISLETRNDDIGIKLSNDTQIAEIS